jgi:deoxyribose-phosphate aldolase
MREQTPVNKKNNPKNNKKTDRVSLLARVIDHTLLKEPITEEDLKKVCDEARQYGFATVCVSSRHVGRVAKLLKGSKVLPISVVGFPTGTAATQEKVKETRRAIAAGAKEIDMVLNSNTLKEKNYEKTLFDICSVVKAASKIPVKVILETCNLTEHEKVIACALSKVAGAAFVKTSTGFSKAGATPQDVALMRKTVGPDMGVKASGGVRTTQDALIMIKAGASRIGTSNGIAIVTGQIPENMNY